MQVLKVLAYLMLVAGGSSRLFAVELRVHVKYVAQDAIYLDAGKSHGISVGDSAVVLRTDSVIAALEVVFVAERSSSCKLLTSSAAPQAGDMVSVYIRAEILPNASTDSALPDSLPSNEQPAKPRTAGRQNVLHGRIGVQHVAHHQLDGERDGYSQPSLLANAQLSKLGGSHYSAALNLRMRRINRDQDPGNSWNSRVYTAALAYEDPLARVSYQAGRFTENVYSAVGYVDGARAEYKWNDEWSVGGFAGFEPEPVNTKVHTDVTKAGIGTRFEKDMKSRGRLRAAAAISGIYDNGNTRREFLHQQFSFSHSQWNFFESASLNFNRGDIERAEGSSTTLTDLNLNANWRPSRVVNLSLGYDNHRNFHTEEPESLADSLFDDAVREGVRMMLHVRPIESGYVSAGGTLRAVESDFSQGKTVTGGVGMQRIARSGLSWDASFTRYENTFSKGSQPSLRVGNRISSAWDVSAGIGNDQYNLEQEAVSISTNWFELETNLRIRRHWYGSASAEFRRGDMSDSNRFIVEAGYRF